MFERVTIRLTIWYVAILMALSLAFSAWLYIEATNEVRTGLNAQLISPFVHILPQKELVIYIERMFQESHGRIVWSLFLLNTGVLVLGSIASHALARRTLRPIE